MDKDVFKKELQSLRNDLNETKRKIKGLENLVFAEMVNSRLFRMYVMTHTIPNFRDYFELEAKKGLASIKGNLDSGLVPIKLTKDLGYLTYLAMLARLNGMPKSSLIHIIRDSLGSDYAEKLDAANQVEEGYKITELYELF